MSLGSSVVEHSTHNRGVAGSKPAPGIVGEGGLPGGRDDTLPGNPFHGALMYPRDGE